MRQLRSHLTGVATAAFTLCAGTSAAAQSAYVAGGVGPTPVLDGRTANRNWFGMAGYPGHRGLGFRLTGTETASRLWLSAELTLQPAIPRPVRPYGLIGGGMVVDLGESDPLLTLGGGIRGQVHRLVFLFAELRLHTIPGSSPPSPRTILPLTFGLGLGT
jgi:hypothetical protein